MRFLRALQSSEMDVLSLAVAFRWAAPRKSGTMCVTHFLTPPSAQMAILF